LGWRVALEAPRETRYFLLLSHIGGPEDGKAELPLGHAMIRAEPHNSPEKVFSQSHRQSMG
jgi:hypothetical protein